MSRIVLTPDQGDAIHWTSNRPMPAQAFARENLDQQVAVELGSAAPVIILSHGRVGLQHLRWAGQVCPMKSLQIARRCLLAVDEVQLPGRALGGLSDNLLSIRHPDGEWFYVAGIWFSCGAYSNEPGSFSLLSVQSDAPGSPLDSELLRIERQIAADWLNPAKDAGYFRRSDVRGELVITSPSYPRCDASGPAIAP